MLPENTDHYVFTITLISVCNALNKHVKDGYRFIIPTLCLFIFVTLVKNLEIANDSPKTRDSASPDEPV